MANTFHIEQKNNKFIAISHNFPECIGEGETEQLAIEDMSRKIVYIKDNNPIRFKNVIRSYVNKLLENKEVPIVTAKNNSLF